MSLPPAFTGSAPSERMRMPTGPREERLLGEEGRPSSQHRGEPATEEGRIHVAQVVGGDDERAIRGQVVQALHADVGDAAEADSREKGDEARIGRQSRRLAHVPCLPWSAVLSASRARTMATTSATVSSNERPSERTMVASSGTRSGATSRLLST